MEYIKLSEQVDLSKVVIGCMRIKDAGMEGEQLLQFVQECLDLGVTSFDHAPVYGGYACEKIFGDSVLRKDPSLREKMKLITKTGIVLPGLKGNKVIYYESSKEQILKEVDESLIKLGTDYIDLLLVHRPDIIGNPAETADALDSLVKSGKVLNVGVSNFMPSQVSMLQSYLSTPLVTNQMELSVQGLDNFFNGVTDDALTRRMPLMAWSPLGGGNVFKNDDGDTTRLRDVIGEIANAHQTSMDVVMYAWLYKHPVEVAAITGTMNINRVKSAVDALDVSLSYDEWYQILAASRGYDVP
ncbi:aldo/keto reductase [Metabacillus endolithicus]|uniref:Aldo/keto reductase family oxidoreductase n=1 Tax=Metabacillus endolithicus TaxID=1535204 RepID=A0ABW5C173_9BACI|nr:aldo/keto reductase [Metabacillus endolithicus]UPG65494.1 aldo/keto reductase [Metabacillus endolithicus]